MHHDEAGRTIPAKPDPHQPQRRRSRSRSGKTTAAVPAPTAKPRSPASRRGPRLARPSPASSLPAPSAAAERTLAILAPALRKRWRRRRSGQPAGTGRPFELRGRVPAPCPSRTPDCVSRLRRNGHANRACADLDTEQVICVSCSAILNRSDPLGMRRAV